MTALQPSKLLGNISHCDIVRCAVEDRPEVINGLNLQEGQQFVSDIFQISGAPFCTSEKILLRFPLFTPALPPSSMIKVKVKYGSKWTDLNGDLRVSKQYFISNSEGTEECSNLKEGRRDRMVSWIFNYLCTQCLSPLKL